jgi:hypothetical protein
MLLERGARPRTRPADPRAIASVDNSSRAVICRARSCHSDSEDLAMSLARVVTILPLIVFAALVAPQAAHAGKFPLFIIISDNPWLIALGVVLVVVWLVARSRE